MIVTGTEKFSNGEHRQANIRRPLTQWADYLKMQQKAAGCRPHKLGGLWGETYVQQWTIKG